MRVFQKWASTDFFEYEYEYRQNRTRVRVLRVFRPSLMYSSIFFSFSVLHDTVERKNRVCLLHCDFLFFSFSVLVTNSTRVFFLLTYTAKYVITRYDIKWVSFSYVIDSSSKVSFRLSRLYMTNWAKDFLWLFQWVYTW